MRGNIGDFLFRIYFFENMAKKIILSAIICLLCTTAFAQKNGDHLVPTLGVLDAWDFQIEYHLRVREILFNGLSDSPIIRFLILGSDVETPRVVEINSGWGFYIVSHVSQWSLWSNSPNVDWSRVRVDRYRSEIDRESFWLIKSLFEVAISQTRFPYENTDGLGGTNYYFFIHDLGCFYTSRLSNGRRSGTIWSPHQESKMGRLVNISRQLMILARSGQRIVRFDDAFQKEIQQLIDELKSNSTN